MIELGDMQSWLDLRIIDECRHDVRQVLDFMLGRREGRKVQCRRGDAHDEGPGDLDDSDVAGAAAAAGAHVCAEVDRSALDKLLVSWRVSLNQGADLLDARRSACIAKMGVCGDNLAMIVTGGGEVRVVRWRHDLSAGMGQLCRLDRHYVVWPVNVEGLGRDSLVADYGICAFKFDSMMHDL